MITGLESAAHKLRWATNHFHALKASIAAYAEAEPHEIIPQADGEETINVREPAPTEIALISGEILYQMRSALDHLAFDLVKLNPNDIALPDGWDGRCLFPLWLAIPPKWKGGTPVPQRFFERTLPGISVPAYTFIESVQPYNGFGTPAILRILAVLSNIDKHRYLNVIKTGLVQMETISTDSFGYNSSLSHTLRDGAKIEPLFTPDFIPEGVNVERTFATFVKFDEPELGGAKALEADQLLEICMQHVATVIVPKFIELLK